MQKETILTLWKKNFSTTKNDTFIYDNIFWLQTKKDFIVKAYLISDYIKKIEWDYIWIMLPSIASTSILIIATYLAWKVPVMLNWTLPTDAFNHCVNFSKTTKILTSSNFYDKIKNKSLDEHREKYIYLENLLRDIKLMQKLKALVKGFFMIIPKLPNTAVILFTSWSESLPKAVALSHENLIENIVWAISIFEIKQSDKLLWFLPPFHSFWFTINTIMPLITAMRVAYTPDPNDAKTILNLIKNCKINVLTATPTFLKMIMALATVSDFETIKYVVVWAEKCSEEVFNKFSELCPNWKILEWYGITECSPVVSINPIEWAKPWTVWKIIPCLDCKILELEKPFNFLEENWVTKVWFNEVELWKQGMIYVCWKSIFDWYMDEKLENPFDLVDAKKYYKTGDLWFLDSDWFLIITGRLKRFIKIAWEMISLPFVEWVLLEKYGSQEELKIAIEALEYNGEAKIVLFSIEHIEVEEVNDYLRKRWVSNLVKISEVIKIESIPVLGTWKVDYKVLRKMINFGVKKILYDFNDIEWSIIKKIWDLAKMDTSKINESSVFWEDIHLDSIDVWELMIFVKTNFKNYKETPILKIKTVANLVNISKGNNI